MVQEVTDVTIEKVLQSNKLVLLEVRAFWCPHCQKMDPIIHHLANVYDDKLLVGQVDTDTNRGIDEMFDVEGLPTMFFVKDERIMDKVEGEISEEELAEKIDNLLN